MQVSLRGMFLITLVAAVVAFSFQSHIVIAYCTLMFAVPIIFSVFFKMEDRMTDESAVFLLIALTVMVSSGFLMASICYDAYGGAMASRSFSVSVQWSGILGAVFGLLAMPYNLFVFIMIRLVQDMIANRRSQTVECESE